MARLSGVVQTVEITNLAAWRGSAMIMIMIVFELIIFS
jgi:hypothetical protein